jgi:F-type H+-transporting ATPase subunit delta
VRESIRGYADALLESLDSDGRRQLADQIDAVQSVLASSDDLRFALADPGLPAPARRNLLNDLFGARIDAITLRLLSYPVEADRATEYPADVTWLAIRTAAVADGRHAIADVVLGRLAAGERIDGYSDDVLADASADTLDNVEDDLFRFSRIIDGSSELATALTDPDFPASSRRALVVTLLEGKTRPETVRLAAYATQVGRSRDYLAHLTALIARVTAESNRRLAEVVSAVELDADQISRLAGALSGVTGRSTQVRVIVDPSILGGFVATVGDTVVDASVRHRLDVMKDRLLLPEATITRQENRADG